MPLRPAPERLHFEPIWTQSRRDTLTAWMDFQDVPRPTAWTDLFVDHLWQGDELMDAVVARFQQIGMTEGRALLDRALDFGIETLDDPPAELVVLFDQLDHPPAVGSAVNRASRLQQAALIPLLGVFAYYGGEDITRALVRATGLVNVNLKAWIRITKVLVYANIGWRRVLDRTPGAAHRAATRNSDTALWGRLLKANRLLAARRGIHGTPTITTI